MCEPCQNVNTVDVILPAWPVLLYTNPVLGKYLLLGLFEYQATGQWPATYAIHDLGESSSPGRTMCLHVHQVLHTPKPSGTTMVTPKTCHSKVKHIYVFHSNPLTPNRMRKHAYHDFELHSENERHFDHHWLCEYYLALRLCCFSDRLQTDLLNQWTGYLVAEALIPAYQISTDDFAGALANQTNLAIKGVIGIQAMAEISGMLGDTTNQQNYSVGIPDLHSLPLDANYSSPLRLATCRRF